MAVVAPTTGWVGVAILRNTSWDSSDMIMGTHNVIAIHIAMYSYPDTFSARRRR